eukprot:3881045-Rhodomonas_salina.1
MTERRMREQTCVEGFQLFSPPAETAGEVSNLQGPFTTARTVSWEALASACADPRSKVFAVASS